ANRTYTGQFIYENLMMEANIINSAYIAGVRKLLFFSSACSYPLNSPQPVKEDSFLNGRPEPTNISYAAAKIAGVVLCQSYRNQYGCNFICAVPTNAYGPGDCFDLKDAHVIPSLIRKFDNAKDSKKKKVVLWGSGRPKREFIFSEDVARASLFLMDKYSSPDIINVGSGDEISIKDLSCLIAKIVGYKGKIVFDAAKPDGAMRKLLDSSKIKKLGWRPHVRLEDGIKTTYEWFLDMKYKGFYNER
ncbi:MAG TPA: GDP-L-fucose synthase, partial [Candidatus Omnitrophota bacterium]|nr:GDP-L-fucose synthase [Candidatus Omnitrophota bacterium]